jgi:hypothetical protein
MVAVVVGITENFPSRAVEDFPAESQRCREQIEEEILRISMAKPGLESARTRLFNFISPAIDFNRRRLCPCFFGTPK